MLRIIGSSRLLARPRPASRQAEASVNGSLYNLYHPPSCTREALAGGFGVRPSFSDTGTTCRKPADKGARCARARYTTGVDHRTNLRGDRDRCCADPAASSMISGRKLFGLGASNSPARERSARQHRQHRKLIVWLVLGRSYHDCQDRTFCRLPTLPIRGLSVAPPHPPDGRSRTKAPVACWGFRLSLSPEILTGRPPLGAAGFRDDRIECLGLIAPSRHGGPPLGADDYFNAVCKGDMFFSQLVGPTLGRVAILDARGSLPTCAIGSSAHCWTKGPGVAPPASCCWRWR